jgi:hypothetical protein
MSDAVTPAAADPKDTAAELLNDLRHAASQRVGRELDDLRAHLIKCCEHSIQRLSKMGFVSLESVTPIVEAFADVAESERKRASHLADLLTAAETRLESVRAECEAQLTAARQQEARECREITERFERKLAEARVAGRSVEEHRLDLAVSRSQFQQIIDAQSLQLAELKRELELARRTPPAVGSAPAPVAAKQPAVLTARERLAETLPFDAIDAALSATPPVVDWPQAV